MPTRRGRVQADARWLEGNAEIPPSLVRQPPTSSEFLQYATSWGAENVLGISYQWWHDPDTIKIRYEKLVQRPDKALLSLARMFDPAAWDENGAIGRLSLPFFRKLPNKHGWQGRPGLWRELIVYVDARSIYKRHRRVFNVMDYSVRPYLLSRASAFRRWQELTTEQPRFHDERPLRMAVEDNCQGGQRTSNRYQSVTL